MIPLMQMLRTGFRALGRRRVRPLPPASAAASVPPTLTVLDRIHTVLASRGGAEPFRLMSDRMSPESIEFQTRYGLRPGETLQVQLLVGREAIRAEGRVAWVLRSAGGGLWGGLELELSSVDRERLAAYLELRSAGPCERTQRPGPDAPSSPEPIGLGALLPGSWL